MTFRTHNDHDILIEGTSYQGEIVARYEELVHCFGKPMDGDGYKTDAEWHVQFDAGDTVSIYNWKNGRNYMGDDAPETEDITEWNIGGRNAEAVALIAEVIRECREEHGTFPPDAATSSKLWM
jgi:hypothetical protein